MTTQRPQIIYKDRHEWASTILASLEADGDGLCWHPLVYVGDWTHPTFGDFTVRPENADAYMAAFEANIPGPAGIPIDEDGLHKVRGEGAWGWVKALRRQMIEVGGKLMDAVVGGIQWTPEGKEAVQTGRFSYISASFFVDSPSNPYNTPNAIFGAALCTRPFFYWQPELQVSAAMEMDMASLREARNARSEKYGIAERKDGRLTPAAHYREFAPRPQDYADPVNLKYPLTNPERLRAIPIQFAQSCEKYDEHSRVVVYTRIVRGVKLAGLRHIPNPTLDKLLPPDLRAWVNKS